MLINLIPVRQDKKLRVLRFGDVLNINGEKLDLSGIPEGQALPAEAIEGADFLAGSISRVDGQLELTLILPIGADAPRRSRFPEPITVSGDGLIDLPPYSKAEDLDVQN